MEIRDHINKTSPHFQPILGVIDIVNLNDKLYVINGQHRFKR